MALRLHHIDVRQNRHRFYQLHVTPDLWGGVVLVREYGRIGHPGTVRLNWFATLEHAEKFFQQLKHQKLKRGYQHVTH